MDAIMRLTYGNENVKFKYRTIEGVTAHGVVPDYLVLHGQQRLTSMFRATCGKDPVNTTTEKGKNIKRYYYLDINKCLDDGEDCEDAVFSCLMRPSDQRFRFKDGMLDGAPSAAIFSINSSLFFFVMNLDEATASTSILSSGRENILA